MRLSRYTLLQININLMMLKMKFSSVIPMKKAKYIVVGAILIVSVCLYKIFFCEIRMRSEDRLEFRLYEERSLAEAMLSEKGSGCDVASVDPFLNNPIAKFEEEFVERVKCPGPDWVHCYLSQCKVIDKILNETKNLKCTFQDLIYVNDWETKLGDPVIVAGDGTYTLERSDHVKVRCTANSVASHFQMFTMKWSGFKVGYRTLPRPEVPKGREKYPNIMLFAFDSTSKNGFIRKMPKSYEVLVKKYEAVVLNKYNIVGDGTVAALFGILLGHTELELPELRRAFAGHKLEDVVFLFSLLKEYGFRTAFFEDSPEIGTFQYRLRGFMRQPTDHYLHAFNKADQSKQYCSGDKLRYSLMIDLTRQFFKLPGPKFSFTFIVEISHNDVTLMRWADDEFSEFLLELFDDGILKNTAVFVLGDHGPRFADFRSSYEGKMEELQPFMAIRLPDHKHSGPENVALKHNRESLTTPFDIHATLLHLTGLEEYKNEYKVPGADMLRGNNLMEMISANRSCPEAGVLAHWCSCLQWRHLADSDPMYQLVATSFRNFVNSLTEGARDKCTLRTITSIKWVTRKQNRNAVLAFEKSLDNDGYIQKFNKNPQLLVEYYQIQVELGPGSGLYEATAAYRLSSKQLSFNERDVSRINGYGDEHKCIKNIKPHLSKYCYCY